MEIPPEFKDMLLGEIIQVQMWERIRRLKRDYIKMGFTHQIAMYGVLTDEKTEESHYKRIDVLSDTPYTEESFTRVYDFIEYFKPQGKYTIWVYSDETKEIVEAESFG